MRYELVNRLVLILVLIAISALFFVVIKPFVVAIFLAALFSTLFHPLYMRILAVVGGRKSISSLATLLIVTCFVFIPVFFLLSTVVSQALELAFTMRPWVQQQLSDPEAVTKLAQSIPFYEQLLPYQDVAKERLGEFFGALSGALIDFAQAATVSTFNALLMGFIIIYTMYFFLKDGERVLYYILYYLPLRDEDEKQLLIRFKSVTRATLKGTAVIGVLQGALAGIALWFGGMPSPLFLSVAMMFMSVVPGIGTAIIWVPAAIYIAFNNSILMGLGIGIFCAVVVGSIDNILRPKLVGNDTRLHELLIFFSTLGGLLLFGFWGFVIGPIIAALFVTVWQLYGDEFQRYLPTTAFIPSDGIHDLPGLDKAAVAENSADQTDIDAGVDNVDIIEQSDTDKNVIARKDGDNLSA